MTDPVLVTHALRGIRWTCRHGLHRFRLMTAHKIDGTYERTERCSRCGTVRTQRGRTRR